MTTTTTDILFFVVFLVVPSFCLSFPLNKGRHYMHASTPETETESERKYMCIAVAMYGCQFYSCNMLVEYFRF